MEDQGKAAAVHGQGNWPLVQIAYPENNHIVATIFLVAGVG